MNEETESLASRTERQPNSEAAKDRVAKLIHWEKTEGLSAAETAELDHYMQLEHLMRLAKARARRHLSHEFRGWLASLDGSS